MIFTNRLPGEAGIHDGGEVETQGSSGSSVQHREGEDYVRSVEGTIKHV